MKNKFIDYLKEEIISIWKRTRKIPDFARIVNVKNWNRLNAMIDDKVILVVSLMNLTVTSLLLLMSMILIVS
jgi:hypothetical protein